ncbi:GAF and ANTAR domain-containing protein [Actinomycetospora lutea]|uniref:GAF and ANTAR domain-containing protein n=1 Tax=Actinomycetospora lutea TaxID=663604 RepID=UPI0023650DBA|nr:GAF and ANTAR domain-containing protein [Actinomycetospora lutea]MDD7937969.1 GAF and ANTAR domain-containing protein [Actinomycetospora lutea]
MTERGDHDDGTPDQERVGAVLARALDASARSLIERKDDQDVEHTLELIVSGAIHTIPHVEQAGISLVERGGAVASHAPSSTAVRELDELQNDLREGPCLDSIRHETRTLVEDMAAVQARWPRYTAAAVDRGFRSLMSFQLFTDHGSAGALNLYAAEPGAFDASSADVGALFAAQAALVLHGAKRITGLTVALDSRDVIGQAKGILIERFGVGPEQAFAMLVESSQQTNIKLVEVAGWLVGEAQKKQRGGDDRRR